MNSGVYLIVNIKTNMFYIGSTWDFISRWRGHKYALNGKRHPCAHLQNAWNKYGESFFKFYILF